MKRGYKQTEVGVVPEDWEVVPLGSICEIVAGRDLVKSEYSPTESEKFAFPIYSNALTNKGLYGYSKLYQYEANKVTVTARGDIGHAVHRNARFCAIGRLLVLSARRSFDLRFLAEFICNVVDFAIESTGVPQLTAPQISKYKVALPPTRAEQGAIAEALSDADALIESLEQLLAKKRQLKQAAMQELLSGTRRLPGFRGEWALRRLGDLAHIKTGKRNNQDKVEDGEFPFFVRSATIERIDSYSHEGEAILVPGEGGIGHIFHYIFGRFDVHQRVYAITQFSVDVSGKFIYFYMVWSFGAYAMENSVKATVDSLRLPTFLRFELRLPPTFDEQAAIATILSDMDAEIAALETKLTKARQIKQGMMQELLTGRIRLV